MAAANKVGGGQASVPGVAQRAGAWPSRPPRHDAHGTFDRRFGHLRRVVVSGDLRPMAGNKEALEEFKSILAGRAAFYSKAQVRLDTSAAPLEPTFAALRSLVRQALMDKG